MGNRMTKNKKQSTSSPKLPPATNGHTASGEREKKPLPSPKINGVSPSASPPRILLHTSTPRSAPSTPSTPSARLRLEVKKDGHPITPDISQSRKTLVPTISTALTAPIPVKTVVVAAYDYESRQPDELAFIKGDKMEVTEDSENYDWCLVKHKKSGKTGYIPRNYVVLEKNSHRIQDWWCPLDRGDAERTLLNPELGRGTFLIRERPDTTYPYALSVKDRSSSKSEYTVRHYRVKSTAKGVFSIAPDQVFKGMEELVRFYSENHSVSTGLCCLLTEPCPKTKPFVPFREMEICKSKIKFFRKMGDGYFGEVWHGKMRNNEDVAIKIMKEGKMSTLNFLKEAKVLHSLRHPKLVPLRGVCTKTRPMMIITELMPKGDLLNYLHSDTQRRLKIAHLVDIASQIASGMSYLEKCNYIHRDLRAANVLVGDHNVVKIADFGLARLVLSEDEIYIMTNQSKVPIKWTAPEALFRREFSTKSDVWSFGVLLFELFSHGRAPYPTISSSNLASMLQSGYRMQKPRNFPDDVYNIMMQCWEEFCENRPSFSHLHYLFDDYTVSTENSYRDKDT